MTRRLHEEVQAAEAYSPAEQRFNRRRQTAGLILGPALFLVVWALPLNLAPPAHRLAAVFALVVILWVTEALPIAVTALLGPLLAVLTRVAPVADAFQAFADPIIFLFIGSFILGEAMFVHGVDRRIAYTALSWPLVGASLGRILVVYGLVAASISMWISNTATAAMMFPIGSSLLAHLARQSKDSRQVERFALGLMLMTSFAASIGGIATPIGTPPNLIGIGMLERIAQYRISFFQWMGLGVPVMATMLLLLMGYFHLRFARRVPAEVDSRAIREELRRLGPVTPGQRNVLIAFAVTVALWLSPGILSLIGFGGAPWAVSFASAVPESMAAMIGAMMLFCLPVDWRARRFTMTWDQAVRIDWGIILLFGGGLALGELAFTTGLADALGRGVTAWLPVQSTASLTVIFTAIAIVVSEAASNTASANMIVPVAIAVANAAGVRPIEPALGATLGASMGFMMPISTPPNAIIYSSGYVPITAMMRYGFVLDILGFAVIVSLVLLLAPVLF